jgi:putative ABC transport system ATP-binding protein
VIEGSVFRDACFTQDPPPRKRTMLKMSHLSKVYRTEVVETYALRDFNIDVKEGEFVAVTGPSGSGKTTFLTIAGLLETFTGGEYHLDGIEVSNLNDNARSKIRNEKIGFIFQAFNLIPDLNVFDNIEVPLRYRGMKAAERKQRIMESLERVGLASRAKHYPAELSGGQQQRVAIARALAGSPRLLLADEPTGNLDTQMARSVLELLEDIHRDGAGRSATCTSSTARWWICPKTRASIMPSRRRRAARIRIDRSAAAI